MGKPTGFKEIPRETPKRRDVKLRILENWTAYLPRFVKVMPVEYRRALAEMAQEKLKNEQPAVRVAEVRAND